MDKKRVALIILDGWGVRYWPFCNAVKQSKHSFYDLLVKEYGSISIGADSSYVGLPNHTMGNSEVGHLTIGSGRINKQDIVRINDSIKDKTFFQNNVLLEAIEHVNKNDSSLHLMGLLSDASVHSHINHLFALLRLAKSKNVKKVYIHAFMDGRDTPPKKGAEYLKRLQSEIKKIGLGEIATIIGRYYAMDRDNRWHRNQIAYECLIYGKGEVFDDPIKAMENAYAKGETDEFIKPLISKDYKLVNEHDSIIFFNFRSDRARQLSFVFTKGDFREFKTRKFKHLHFYTFTKYDDKIERPVAFPHENIKNVLGEVIADNDLKQLRVAETEKYAHVTYFFNGGSQKINRGEDRILVESPKVETYDLKPEMSAQKITDETIGKVTKKDYSLVVLNYANPDMVGHTGRLDKAVEALEFIDKQLRVLVPFLLMKGFEVIITADHGNCEDMCGEYKTSHTLNHVPFTVVSKKHYRYRGDGSLSDIAPTILDLLSLPKPEEMTGSSLIRYDA